MYVKEYCSSCGNKTFRKTEPCECSKMAESERHKDEFENIICDMESAIYADPLVARKILEKSIQSVRRYIEEHFG